MINFNYLELQLVDHCNLNCAFCTHYSPIAPKNFKNIIEFEQEIISIKKLLDNRTVQSKFILALMGGEPLLHPNIEEICKIARKYLNDTNLYDIEIVTNGLLLPSQNKNFIDCINQNNIKIYWTCYQELSNTVLESIRDCLKLYNNTSTRISDGFHNIALDFNCNDEIKKVNSFFTCTGGLNHLCTFLKNGRLYHCAIEANSNILTEYFNLPTIKVESLDITNITIWELLEFINKPSNFCKYCNLPCRFFYKHWRLSNKQIIEWIKH